MCGRLLTLALQIAARRRHTAAVKERKSIKSRDAEAAYRKMMAARREATRSKRLSKLSKKRSTTATK
jgi:hypothetical protein